ncbi:MAG: hypothetical protein IJ549_00155 [Prevotella sp.]|nr:hypothetical protein [Prevotella sp.]MBQ8701166.1 hypothetical protein [Prevotella sp.]MBQ9650852.1 hypothetical protein [Prevotella sp.]
MRKTIALAVLTALSSLLFMSAATGDDNEARPFKGRFYNAEHKIYIDCNLYDHNIIIPMQEVLGELDGYIASDQCGTTWCIVSSNVKGNKATIDVINNYGSEDFTATLKIHGDTTLTYSHEGGSTLKFPVNRKWQKIPAKLTFKRTR